MTKSREDDRRKLWRDTHRPVLVETVPAEPNAPRLDLCIIIGCSRPRRGSNMCAAHDEKSTRLARGEDS